jgi:uncharacterized protein
MELHRAAQAGDVDRILALLAAGAAVDERDDSGDTPLMVAARVGHEAAFIHLLQAGADPNAVGYAKATPLHWASRAGRPMMVKALLLRGAKIDALSESPDPDVEPGMTPFQAALFDERHAIARLLAEMGANVNAPMQDGRTALEYARELDDQKAIQLLQELGVKE